MGSEDLSFIICHSRGAAGARVIFVADLCTPKQTIMAIFGTIETIVKQSSNPACARVAAFIETTDLEAVFNGVLSEGKNRVVEIDGREVYAIFQAYQTRRPEQCKIEGHRRYVDLQYVFRGSEWIGYADLSELSDATPYSEADDIYFGTARRESRVLLTAGTAAYLEPCDLHAPGIMDGEPQPMLKIVFKIKTARSLCSQ